MMTKNLLQVYTKQVSVLKHTSSQSAYSMFLVSVSAVTTRSLCQIRGRKAALVQLGLP